MAKIKNMGTATMRFGEGVIVSGSAAQPDGTSSTNALIVSGTIKNEGSITTDSINTDSISTDSITLTGASISDIKQEGNLDCYIRFRRTNDFPGIQFVNGGFNMMEFWQDYDGQTQGGSTQGAVIINQDGLEVDFRVETNNKTSAIYVDATNDVVYLGGYRASSPAGTDVVLYVSGTTPSGGGGKGTANGATVINSDLVVSGTYRGGYDPDAGSESFQAVSDNFFFLTNDADFGGSQIQALDSNFFVSGAIGSRGGDTPGTAVFGGDVLVSGTLNAENGGTINISQGTSYPQSAFQIQSSLGTMFAAYGSPADVDLTAPAVYVNPANNNIDFFVKTGPNDKAAIVVDAEREYIAFMSGGLDDSPSATNPILMSDTNFFASGSIGSRGGGTRGTAVFGGDVVTSGSLVVESQASFEDYMIISVSADNTDLQTGAGLVTLRAPFAMDLYQIPRASLTTNGTTQTTVDINVGGTTIMGVNKLTIDANEGTSTTAATAAALTTTSITDDQQITIDVDAAGTGARGLKVTLYYRRTF